jgi:hypothetical protein
MFDWVNGVPPAELAAVSYQNAEWSATRLGLATLASGKAAVRQRIMDRTGLSRRQPLQPRRSIVDPGPAPAKAAASAVS